MSTFQESLDAAVAAASDAAKAAAAKAATVTGGGGTVSDATLSSKGIVRLAGDLNGTADAPTVVTATEGRAGKVALATTAEAQAGTDTAKAVTSAGVVAAVGTKAEVATLNNAFGSEGGNPIKPWVPSKVVNRELWVTSNFETNTASFPRIQSASTSMSLTGNSTEHGVRTLANYIAPSGLPPYDNGSTFRLEFDYDGSGVTTGNWRISIALVDSGDVVLGQRQLVATDGSPAINKAGHFLHDFTILTNTRYVEVDLYMWSNVTGGTVTVSNVTLKRTTAETRPMLFMGQGLNEGGTNAGIARQVKDVSSNAWYYVEESIGSGTAANDFYNFAYAYDSAYPWNNAQTWADPSWQQTYTWMGGAPGAATTLTAAAVTTTKLRINNNDQIIVAKNAAGTYEFRGNSHGGEVTAAGRTYKVDQGDGVWTDVTSRLGSNNVIPCRRIQWDWPTTITSSDEASPFASVSHLFTVFPDGVTRCDRTTTFNRATEIGEYYEWMSSYDYTDTTRNGRIGRGLTVLGNVDASATDSEDSDAATWAVWYDPTSGWCHASIYDREAILSRSSISGSYVRILQNTGSIQKQYNMLTWDGPAGSFVVPSGTAWTATHWSFVYRPEDTSRYHNEVAMRAASLTALKDVYPNT